MILSNVNIIGSEGKKQIRIDDQKITAVTTGEISKKNASEQVIIEFDNAVAFPGLINSHDHLDFNLFPQTGNRIYNNYTDWGREIHEKNKGTINAVLKIPQPLRIEWGIYKNLLCGITTVINHGEKLDIQNDMITVFQNCYSLHSVGFEKKWRFLLNKPFIKELPFVVHVGEGTDMLSHNEIDHLIKWNMFKRKIIGIHGVAMDEAQAQFFHALVWCPVSNSFLLNKTSDIQTLKNKTTILFGTDSTLTAGWNIWEHLRSARTQQQLTDMELFNSVTSTAASIWKLNSGEIAANKTADIVIARSKNKETGLNAFYSLDPEDILLVMHKGKVCLYDEELNDQFKNIAEDKFTGILLNGTHKHIAGDPSALIKKIRAFYPGANFPIND